MTTRRITIITTSAPHNRPEYRRDFLDCIANPIGKLVRFSYRKKWIDQSLLDSEPPRNCIIIFCDIPIYPEDDYIFYPVRYATFEGFGPTELIKFKDDNIYISANFKLGNFINIPPGDSKETIARWKAWMQEQSDHYPRPLGNPKNQNSKMVLLGRLDSESKQCNESSSWQMMMDMFSKSNTLNECTFLRLVGIKKSKKYLELSSFRSHDVFMLRSEKSYEIELQHYLGYSKPLPSRELVPSTASESLSLSPVLINNIARVTSTVTIINTKRVSQAELAPVVIEDPKDISSLSPRIQLIFGIKPLRRYLIAAIMMMAFGALFVGISKETIKELSKQGSFFYNNPGTIEYFMKALGAIFVGLGGYFGFKQPPK